MSKITTFLTYKKGAEDAATLYTSVFENSRILSTSRYGEGSAGAKDENGNSVPVPVPGSVMTVEFELDGQRFVALNGGDYEGWRFTEGISLSVECGDQAEVDTLTEKLTAGGGEIGQCGWIKDRFGLSWQINPRVLGEMLGDKDPEKAKRVMQAMLKMKKIDIAELRRAYAGEAAKV
jgi:predicted 3-demethylubiquinone-9 3-methyltransferase (glyoxalase superfamily)